jgi:hypothetical protein
VTKLNNQKIKLEDLPATKIYILLTKEMREDLIDLSKNKLGNVNNYKLANHLNMQSNKYGLSTKFNGGDINYMQAGEKVDIRTNIKHLRCMPLWLILELSNISEISLERISKMIHAYRSNGSGNLIFNPKIPIDVNPELESIIFHIFGDGSGGNRTPMFFQKNGLANKQFLSKLKNCFGDFDEKYYRQGQQIKFPKVITDILTHYYDIDSYNSNLTRIPAKIYQSPKLNKIACIIAYILDEGNIRDIISIASMNKKFLLDLKRLIESCGYECKNIKPHKGTNIFDLNISNNTIEELYNDYIKLIDLYPACGLANKYKDLIHIISRRKNKVKMNYIDKEIVSLIKLNKLTTKEISWKLGLANCTTLHHLQKLYKEKIINRVWETKRFIWYIKE